jgi:hypothetical protein
VHGEISASHAGDGGPRESLGHAACVLRVHHDHAPRGRTPSDGVHRDHGCVGVTSCGERWAGIRRAGWPSGGVGVVSRLWELRSRGEAGGVRLVWFCADVGWCKCSSRGGACYCGLSTSML